MAFNFDINKTQSVDQIVSFIQLGCAPKVSIDNNQLDDRNEVLLAHLEVAKSVLNKLNNLLTKLISNDINLKIKPQDILHSSLYLCGEHCKSNLPWSDVESHSMMNSCIDKLCHLMHYSNTEELFTQVDISKIFVGMQYKLENNNWKKYPAAVECFMWMLKYLKVNYTKFKTFIH